MVSQREKQRRKKLMAKVPSAKPQMGLIVNSGEDSIGEATLPLRWFFSPKAAELAPTHVLLFEQNQSECDNLTGCAGRRYWSSVSNAVFFMQFFSPGYHRVSVLAFAGPNAKEEVQSYFVMPFGSNYGRSITSSQLELGQLPKTSYNDVTCVSGTVVEFTVPEGVFAQKPVTKVGKFLWWWANFYYKKKIPLRDNCDFRKRLLCALTFHLLITTPVLLILHLLTGLIGSLVSLVADAIVLFAGWRPNPFWSNVRSAFTWDGNFEWDVNRYSHGYKVWFEGYDEKGVFVIKRMPLSPAEFLSIVAILNFLFSLFQRFPSAAGVLFLSIFCGTVVLAPIIFFIMKWNKGERRRCMEKVMRRGQELKQEEDRQKAESLKQRLAQVDWLKRNLLMKSGVAVVDLENLPRPATLSGLVVQKLYVSFWATKMKICRPYAK